MGLDMYLTRKIYVGGNYEHNEVEGDIDLKSHQKRIPLDVKKITYIEEDAGYWRKANAIHNWFVNNVQDGKDDCGDYYVSIDKLKELLSLCKKVKELAVLKDGKVKNGQHLVNGDWETIYENGRIIENAEEIANILPTQSGFFFGSTEYDEWYLQDIEDTIEILEEQIERDKELKAEGVDTYLQYHSSW